MLVAVINTDVWLSRRGRHEILILCVVINTISRKLQFPTLTDYEFVKRSSTLNEKPHVFPSYNYATRFLGVLGVNWRNIVLPYTNDI